MLVSMTDPPNTDQLQHKQSGLFNKLKLQLTGGTSFADLPVRRKVVLSQLPMFVAVLITCAIASFSNREQIFGDGLFVTGIYIVFGITLASWVVPWEKFRNEFTYLVLPALGLIAASLMAVGAYQWLSGVTLLIGFPIFWFAWSGFMPRITMLLSFVFPLATTWLQLWNHGVPFTTVNVVRPLLIPVVLLALACTTVIVEYNTSLKDRQLRESLANSRRQADLLNAVLNAANVGVVVIDGEGNDVLMNDIQRFQHLHAMPSDIADPTESQLLVRALSASYEPLVETMAASDRPVFRASQREEFTDELLALGPMEEPAYHSTSARQLFDETGNHDGAVIMFKNVTPMVEASKTKDRFLANVSHELRTPLTSILGYLELLEDNPTNSASTEKSLGIISRNTNRLLCMVNDLLTAASGRQEIHAINIDLGALVATRLEFLAPRAAAAGIELKHGILCNEPMRGDSLRLGQIVDNLVSNSIKYSDPGDSIVVELDSDEDEIRLSVTDTGHGISEKDCEQLFTRFFRSEDARLSGLPGVGLGLAITQELVVAHGGIISAQSKLGQGTTMVVTLPRRFTGAIEHGVSEPLVDQS